MFLVNTDYIEGRKLEMLGIVTGGVVESKHIGRDLGAGFKTIIGGEIKGYTEMMEEARRTATYRMIEEAEKLSADAIINVKYASSAVMQGASEVMAYGTAVRFV